MTITASAGFCTASPSRAQRCTLRTRTTRVQSTGQPREVGWRISTRRHPCRLRLPMRNLGGAAPCSREPDDPIGHPAKDGRPIPSRLKFHDLRHSFAVDHLRTRRGSISHLQQTQGDESIKTTELYPKFLTPEERQQAKSMPAHA